MAFWVPTFEKCAGRVARSGFEDLCDEAAADALECAFAHVIAKSKLAEAASAGEGEAVEVRLRVPEGTVLAAKEALREGKLCKLSAVAMDVFDYSMCSEFLNEQSVDSVEIVSSLEILPQICKIMREAAGVGVAAARDDGVAPFVHIFLASSTRGAAPRRVSKWH